MGVELLVAARELGGYEAGDVVVMKRSPWQWGRKEALPDFAAVTIEDGNIDDYRYLLAEWPQLVIVEDAGAGAADITLDRRYQGGGDLHSAVAQHIKKHARIVAVDRSDRIRGMFDDPQLVAKQANDFGYIFRRRLYRLPVPVTPGIVRASSFAAVDKRNP